MSGQGGKFQIARRLRTDRVVGGKWEMLGGAFTVEQLSAALDRVEAEAPEYVYMAVRVPAKRVCR